MSKNVFKVVLYKEDISRGYAKRFSRIILGKTIPAIWHVSIVLVYKENCSNEFKADFSYNCDKGVTLEDVNETPDEKVLLGYTNKSPPEIVEFLDSLKFSEFHFSKYSLYTHNCFTFAEKLSNFLGCGSLPEDLREFPKQVKRLIQRAGFMIGLLLTVPRFSLIPTLFASGGALAVLPMLVPMTVGFFGLPFVVRSIGSSYFRSTSSRSIGSGSSNSQISPQSGSRPSNSQPVNHQIAYPQSGFYDSQLHHQMENFPINAVLQPEDYFQLSPRSDLTQMYWRRFKKEYREDH